LCLLVASSFAVAAPDKILVNSGDWKDVYSSMLYGTIAGIPTNFLTSARHSTIILYSVDRELSVDIVSSKKNAFVAGYRVILEGRGYESVTEEIYDDVNLGLAERLTDVKSFIVIDPSYGYNALSAAPYAALSKSFVLFVDNKNVGKVRQFLDKRGVDKMILFGQLDREVKDSLSSFNPEIINEGDRFDNNVAIVKKYMAIKPTKQVLLSNGEFIEQGLMSGTEPVLFIGKTNVPDATREYIKGSDIEVGVLVGNELIGSATFVRRTLGISVFVKFAQGSRTPSGSIAPVEDLDRFPMPSYNLNLDIFSIAFNKGSNSLEVTYHNLVDLGTYFKSSIQVQDSLGSKTIGDIEPLFIDGGEYKTVVYTATSDGERLTIQGDNASAHVITIYGEGKKSLEFTLEKTLSIETVTVLDQSDIEIVDLVYDSGKGQFEVKIRSIGDADAFVRAEIVDVLINEESVTLGSDGAPLIKKGSSAWMPVKGVLSEQDILANKEFLVQAYYGERENALIKVKTKTFPFKKKAMDYTTIALVAVVVILFILLMLARKKRCPKCGTKNKKNATHCKKCNHLLKETAHSAHQGSHQG
jgi:archaellum component FlaF (FlaF/FlaG flagellin family)